MSLSIVWMNATKSRSLIAMFMPASSRRNSACESVPLASLSIARKSPPTLRPFAASRAPITWRTISGVQCGSRGLITRRSAPAPRPSCAAASRAAARRAGADRHALEAVAADALAVLGEELGVRDRAVTVRVDLAHERAVVRVAHLGWERRQASERQARERFVGGGELSVIPGRESERLASRRSRLDVERLDRLAELGVRERAALVLVVVAEDGARLAALGRELGVERERDRGEVPARSGRRSTNDLPARPPTSIPS